MNYHAEYLNLDHRKDRRTHMEAQLSKINLKVERRRGKIPHDYDLNDPRLQVMRNRTPGAIACHFGQVDIIKAAYEQGKNAIVFEDDCVFCEDFNDRMAYIDDWCHRNTWDIFWLGSSVHINPPYWHRLGGSGMPPDCSAHLGYDAKRTGDKRIIRTFGAFVTFAYMVNVESIPKVLNLLDYYLHESIGIDWLMIKIQPQLECFAFLPGCVKQMDSESNIGTGVTRWSGFLNLGPYVFQERMEHFNPDTFAWNEAR